jgi:hypothetical protein
MEPVFEHADIPSPKSPQQLPTPPRPLQQQRNESNLRPLLIEIPSLTSFVIRTPPLRQRQTHPFPHPLQPSAWTRAHIEALRFSIHLTLISVFETLFFWLFVSQSEDAALVHLVNSYTGNLLTSCATMTEAQRASVTGIIDVFVNQTVVDAMGAIAAADRAVWNGGLQRNSWYYVSGLAGLTVTLGALARCLKRRMPWQSLLAENAGLVALLGLYEWMFFHTVVFRYKAISPAELDRMVVDELMASC